MSLACEPVEPVADSCRVQCRAGQPNDLNAAAACRVCRLHELVGTEQFIKAWDACKAALKHLVALLGALAAATPSGSHPECVAAMGAANYPVHDLSAASQRGLRSV